MSENKDTMVDDAIEWLNEIRCWINRCKDTEWGDDDQRIVDFITTALSALRVPVIPGLGEAIKNLSDCENVPWVELNGKDVNDLMKLLKAARWVAELQKGV